MSFKVKHRPFQLIHSLVPKGPHVWELSISTHLLCIYVYVKKVDAGIRSDEPDDDPIEAWLDKIEKLTLWIHDRTDVGKRGPHLRVPCQQPHHHPHGSLWIPTQQSNDKSCCRVKAKAEETGLETRSGQNCWVWKPSQPEEDDPNSVIKKETQTSGQMKKQGWVAHFQPVLQTKKETWEGRR